MVCGKGSIIANLLVLAVGAAITGLGIYLKVDKDFWKIQENLNIKEFGTASTILIIVGVVIMLVGFCGFWGAVMSKIWMLVLFSVIILIIIVLEIVVVALVWTTVASQSAQEDLELKAKTALQHISDDDSKRAFIDLLQKKLECCGIDGPGDYNLDKKNPKSLPGSCTPKGSVTPYEKGCYAAVVEFLKGKAGVVGGVAVAVILLQVGALIFASYLICNIKKCCTNIC